MIGAGFVSAMVYGRGYTAPQPRPDQMAVRFTETATPCVTCHRDGRFSYWDRNVGVWIENDNTVPQHVLDGLPQDERGRVMKAMTAAGVVAA